MRPPRSNRHWKVCLGAALLAFLYTSPQTASADAPPPLSVTRYDTSQKHVKTEKWPEADALLRLIIATDPNRIEPWVALAKLWMREASGYPQARALLEFAHKRDEDSPWPLVALSDLTLAEGDDNTSADLLRKAARADLDNFRLQIDTATRLSNMRRFDEAQEHFEFAAALQPLDPSVVTGLGVMWNGLGRYDDAIKLYRESLSTKGFNAEVFINLCNTFLASSRAPEVLDLIAKHRADTPTPDPTFDRILDLLNGRALLDLQRFDDAIASFRNAAIPKDQPQNGQSIRAHYLLGLALSMKGCDAATAPKCKASPDQPCCQAAAEALEHFDVVVNDTYGKNFHQSLPIQVTFAQQANGDLEGSGKTIGQHIGLRLGLAQLEVGQLIEAEGTLHDQIQKGDGSLGEAYAAMAVTLLAFAERDGDDRDNKQALRLYHEACQRAPDFLTPDLLLPRWQWPPRAIDAIRKLKQMSDDEAAARKAAEAAAAQKAAGCRCQSLLSSSPSPLPRLSLFALLLSFFALGWRRHRSRRHA